MPGCTPALAEKIARHEAGRVAFSNEAEQTLRLLSGKKRKVPSVLVLGRDSFSDNSKYLYLALVARAVGFPIYWGTFNRAVHDRLAEQKLPVLDLAADASAVLPRLLEISCVVYCTNPGEATGNPLFRAALAGAHKMQLWHGVGLKRLDLQNTSKADLLNPRTLRELAAVVDIDEVLSPSSMYDDQWREAFGVDRVLRAGFPRNEVLLRAAAGAELIDVPVLSPAIQARGVVLFAPTWTPQGAQRSWLDLRLINTLAGFADRIGATLAIKPHPFDSDAGCAELQRLAKSVLVLPPKSDVYPLLSYVRALVTDFSSLASDFLLCDRPVLFFRSTLLEQRSYAERCMPELPGRHVREETIEAFMTAWSDIEHTTGARRRLRDLYFETDPLQANATIVDRLVEIVEQKTRR